MNARALAGVVLAGLLLAGCDQVPLPAFAAGATPVDSTVDGPVVVSPPTASFLREQGRHVQVERVIDGDTIAVTGDERVRLLTINASELHSNTKADDADCGAKEARNALTALLPVGTDVILDGLKGEPATDRYGRTLSDVFVEHNGQLINVSLWLVDQGWARTYTSYPTSETDQAAALEVQAQAERRGMWVTC